jgi:hypothetical protein
MAIVQLFVGWWKLIQHVNSLSSSPWHCAFLLYVWLSVFISARKRLWYLGTLGIGPDISVKKLDQACNKQRSDYRVNIVVPHAFNIQWTRPWAGRKCLIESFRVIEWNALIRSSMHQNDRRVALRNVVNISEFVTVDCAPRVHNNTVYGEKGSM